MPRPFRIFLATGLENYKLNVDGQLDPQTGISAREISQRLVTEIKRFGGDRIDVVMTEDPVDDFISSKVRKEIDQADAMVCLFTKRVFCPVEGLWTTSQYVTSESGYGACRFGQQAAQRTYCLVENGVDHRRLGLAFPADRPHHEFHRDRLDAALPKLEEFLTHLLGSVGHDSHDPQHLLLQKRVFIKRDGRAKVETLHRFRVCREMNFFRMNHTLWRVREELSPIQEMLEKVPERDDCFFKFVLNECGAHDAGLLQWKIDDLKDPKHQGKEIEFKVEINKLSLKPGDRVEYQFAWSYPHAFCTIEALPKHERNSAGLRAGACGMIRDVVFQLVFDRNWNSRKLQPCIDVGDFHGPQVWTRNDTRLPGTLDPREFWHQEDGWTEKGCMVPCPELQSPVNEAYQWSCRDFSGLVKATWQPHFNYHQPTEEAKIPSAVSGVDSFETTP